MNRKVTILLILLLIFALGLAMRLPKKDYRLASYDRCYAFQNGAQLMQTSPLKLDINEPYKNTIVRLFVFNNHGISNLFLQSGNLLLFKLLNINLTWWNQSFMYYFIGSLTIFLIYALIKNITNNSVTAVLSACFWAVMTASVASAVRPCWIPFCTFFSVLSILSLLFYFKRGSYVWLLISSIVFTLDLLGDVTFLVNALLIGLIIHYQFNKKPHLWTKNRFIAYSALPAASLLLVAISAVVSLYKGYNLSLLGYILGHKGERGIPFANLANEYAEFFHWMFWNTGIFFFIALALVIVGVFYRRRRVFEERLFFIWSWLLLIPTLLFNREDIIVTLAFMPLLLYAVVFLHSSIKSKKALYIALCILIIVQVPFTLNLKYDIYKIPEFSYKNLDTFHYPSFKEELEQAHNDFGQMAVGCWIRENLDEDDEVMIFTPFTEDHFFKKPGSHNSEEVSYAVGTSLYSTKVYTFAKGLADKKLYSLKNVFFKKPLYSIQNHPI